MSPHETIWTVVVAGGSGRRFGGLKQFERLGDGPDAPRLIDLAVEAARAASHGVVVVVPAADVPVAGAETRSIGGSTSRLVAGGDTRSESVRAGLAAVPDHATIVCVHDAARPFAGAELFTSVIDAVIGGADGAVPGVAVADTIKVVGAEVARPDDSGHSDRTVRPVIDTPERSSLVAVQTPQAFRAGVLRAAHAARGEGTDDASLVERAGGVVVVVPGHDDNRKITRPEDLDWVRRRWLELGAQA